MALAFVGYLGDLKAAEESVGIARTTNDKWLLAYSLVWQSHALRTAGGDMELAQQAAAEGAELSREIGSVWAVARSVFSQGQLAVALGKLDEARAHFQESMALFTQSQDEYHANMARTELAHVERMQGNDAAATELYKAAILIWHDLGLQAAVARLLEYLAIVADMQRNSEHAVRLAGLARRIREQARSRMTPDEQVEYDNFLEGLRRRMDMPRFQTLLVEGQYMSITEATANT
jgi:tetratricopeptide (TPR) repeat protein